MSARPIWQYAAALLCFLSVLLRASPARADVTIGVDSRAARFSPATWVGNLGRSGSLSRTTWNNGAWCAFYWSSFSDEPKATLSITNPTRGSAISYYIDGTLVDDIAVPRDGGITIRELTGAGPHTLVVYTRNSPQDDRWRGRNAYTVRGLTVEDGATPGGAPARRPWVLMVGDSITEGIQADNGKDSSLSDYSFLVGQALSGFGYDYAVSACGYSGWVRPGDAHGDVPGYYVVEDGEYQPGRSRWSRLDLYNSLLDARGYLSGDGSFNDAPSAIVFNYMVNEALNGTPPADARASVTGALTAVRRAVPPTTTILVVVPPGLANTRLYPRASLYLAALREGVADYVEAHPGDKRTLLVDLGPEVANALASPAYGGGVHPNAAGHAYIAAQILPRLLGQLPRGGNGGK